MLINKFKNMKKIGILFSLLCCGAVAHSQNVRYQSGYYKESTGTYVDSHYKTSSNNTNLDNFSTKGNYNYYTGEKGTRAQDYSSEAYNYGQGKTIYEGPKGGQYYINDNNNKVYVPKRR